MNKKEIMFPSPLGVIFSLMVAEINSYNGTFEVSVSSRSYILSYYGAGQHMNETSAMVSVSSRSYILSYTLGS